MPKHPEQSINRARGLRSDQSPPEGVLWSRLRDRRLGGLKFRRQHPVEGITVDFYCAEASLVVELDSSYHAGRQDEDENRDRRLAEIGLLTVRVTASQLTTNPDGVLELILRTGRSRIESED